ncbi:hypothetical protein [Treponema bryantii]|nr:hypothetical protein TRBR_13190 [Treponema bryantii]
MEYDSFGRLIKGWLPQNEKRNSYTTADAYLVYDAQETALTERKMKV